MSEKDQRPVVVAVSDDSMDAALGYAVDEAARAGCGLHLVHVVHPLPMGPDTVLMDGVNFERAGHLTMQGALERARDLAPAEMPVTSELVWGGVVTSIVDVGARGRLIVLQRRELSRVMRVVTRSVSSGVAARSHVPVVSVPAGWSPTDSGDEARTVTVGVDVPERGEHILRAAAQAAQARGARLRVLHTWSLPSAYEDIVLTRTEDEEWVARARDEIQATLDEVVGDLPGLDVTIEVRHAFPSDALIEAGRTSDLLVVGRHDPLIPIGSHLGPVARAVLREATCPVLLADPATTRHWPSRHDRRAES